MKAQLGKLWTDAVAYVALAIGAGLSITFNVVDTLDIRGAAVDPWDIVTAVAFPSIVVLMVEMFVSSRWAGQAWPMQTIRWVGTLTIGGIAMLVSWTHGHDFLSSRGQLEPVPTLGPLSIDLLAIMATALILSGRGHVLVPAPVLEDTEGAEDTTWLEDIGQDALPEDIQTPDVLPSWLDGLEDRTGPVSHVQAYAIQDTPRVSTKTAAPVAGRLSPVQRDEARMLMEAGRTHGAYPVGELRQLVAAWFGVNPKTIQRAEAPVGLIRWPDKDSSEN